MNQGIASLHKILKDKTRQKIITLLNDKGSLSYSDLMEGSNLLSTGQLNYHLKVLGDILEKNENGQYRLSEKGKTAYKVLSEFPNGQPINQAHKWKKVVATILAVANIINLIVSTVLFSINYIDWHLYSSQIIYSFVAFLVAFIIFKLPTSRPKYDPNRARKLTGFFFVLGGALFTSIFVFFVLGFILMSILGTTIPSGLLGTAYLLFSFVGGAMIGGIIGYLLYKRSKYSDPHFYSPF
jgi:hypothetical protein